MPTLMKGQIYRSKAYGLVKYLGAIVEEDCCIHKFEPTYGKRKYILEQELEFFLDDTDGETPATS